MGIIDVSSNEAAASILDAKLHTALKAHDCLHRLLRCTSTVQENRVMNELIVVMNELDELLEVQHG